MRTRDIAIAGMFQSVRPRDPTVCEPRITINQQSHDAADAARLLSELERKAQERVLAAITVTNNRFQCHVQTERSQADRTIIGRVIFTLNGLRHVVDHAEPEAPDIERTMVEALIRKTAEKVATEMIGPALRGLLHG